MSHPYNGKVEIESRDNRLWIVWAVPNVDPGWGHGPYRCYKTREVLPKLKDMLRSAGFRFDSEVMVFPNRSFGEGIPVTEEEYGYCRCLKAPIIKLAEVPASALMMAEWMMGQAFSGWEWAKKQFELTGSYVVQ